MGFQHFYQLDHNPFSKAIPVKDAYKTEDFVEMERRLAYLIDTGGIGIFCASPGFGKSFCVRAFAQRANKNTTSVAYICLSTVSTGEFYRQLCRSLNLEAGFKKSDMFKSIQEHLYYSSVEKRIKTLVIVDEAQYLSNDILRDLKMITNFNMDSRDCVSIALIGQPSLADLLSRSIHEALAQRIVVNYTFCGLKETEVNNYIEAMLKSAGSNTSIIDNAALLAAYGCSNGSIRKLNTVLTNALRIGAQHHATSINTEMVLAANEEVALR